MLVAQSDLQFYDKTVRFWTPNEVTKGRVTTIFEKEPITIEWMGGIEPGETVFDVGANVGMYTLMSSVGRGAKVHAFEPEAGNFFLLNENIKLNGVGDRVTGWCTGVLDFDGESRLYVSTTSGFGRSGHSVAEEVNFDLTPRRKTLHRQGIGVVSLDGFCRRGGVTADHIKIDVDGLEYRIIMGNPETLSRAKTVIVEIQTRLPSHQRAVEFMGELGFRFDPSQVKGSMRTAGAFEGTAEHLFYK